MPPGLKAATANSCRSCRDISLGMCAIPAALDNRMRELVTVTVLTVLSALPQLKAHVGASLNAGCTPVEVREAVYQCAPFIGFPKTLNAIAAMNEVFSERGIDLPLPGQSTLASPNERFEKGLAIQAPLYGDEIKERYTWLPKPFDEAVPRFLTELCFGDFGTRTGLDERTRELLTVVLLAAMGGAEVQVKKSCGRRAEGGQYQRGACLRPGACRRLYGNPAAVQCPQCLQRSADRRIKNFLWK